MNNEVPTPARNAVTAPLRASGAPIEGEVGPASLVPFGIHEGTPLLTAAWHALAAQNALRYGFDILQEGVCTGCALGSRGLFDEHTRTPHLCGHRLDRLHTHLAAPVRPERLGDLRGLRALSPGRLEDLGPIDRPYLLRPGSRTLAPLSWEDALTPCADALGQQGVQWVIGPDTPSNEATFAMIDAARRCGLEARLAGADAHLRAMDELQACAGVRSATVGLHELSQAETVLLWDAHLVEQHPLLARTLARAKAGGARLVGIGPYRAPSLDRTWHTAPLFGTRLIDDHIHTHAGGEPAAAQAAAMLLEHWAGQPSPSIDPWVRASGAGHERLEWLATVLSRSSKVVSCWSTDLGPRAQGIVALHRAARALGPGAGLLPLPRHVGGIGAIDMGVQAPFDPGAATETVVALGTVRAPSALRRIHLLRHLHPGALQPPPEGGWALLLPTRGVHQSMDGITTTNVERRVRFSPPIPGSPDPGDARDAHAILGQLLAAAGIEAPSSATGQALRDAIAEAVPSYRGIETLRAPGHAFQWGGAQLAVGPSPGDAPALSSPPDGPVLRTLPSPRDGSPSSHALLSARDADALGLSDGSLVRIEAGEERLVLPIAIADVHPGTVIVHGESPGDVPCTLGPA